MNGVVDVEEVFHSPFATLTRIKGEEDEGEKRIVLNTAKGVI